MKTGLTPDVGTDQLTLTIEDNDGLAGSRPGDHLIKGHLATAKPALEVRFVEATSVDSLSFGLGLAARVSEGAAATMRREQIDERPDAGRVWSGGGAVPGVVRGSSRSASSSRNRASRSLPGGIERTQAQVLADAVLMVGDRLLPTGVGVDRLGVGSQLQGGEPSFSSGCCGD